MGSVFADHGGEPWSDEGRADVLLGPLPDCNDYRIPDAVEIDCNDDEVPDDCDLAAGTSADSDGDGLPDECELAGTAYCFGDGAGTPCPCGNSGAPGHGCANAHSPLGARLVALGLPSASSDALSLRVSESAPGEAGLFFQGDLATNAGLGLPFGDGLRCANGNVVRLELAVADSGGSASSSVSIAQTSGVSAGDGKRYPWWYRDSLPSICGAGFNLSNGVELEGTL